MTTIDWIARWNEGQTGFHEGRPNVHLVTHFGALGLPAGGRVFVPFCGKSVDMHWLLGQGCRVVGAELSELAVKELFGELGVAPVVSDLGAAKLYSAEGIDVSVGDLFALTRDQVGEVDAVYDRAAFVALPEAERGRYADHVAALAGGARQLLITYAYDDRLMSGPPFSIADEEVFARHDGRYIVRKLEQATTAGLRGVPAEEHIWLLEPR